MTDQLQMFNLTTCEDSPSAISSLASADGPKHCDSQDGQRTDQCGPAVAPAKASPAPAKDKARQTRDTYGHISIGSSASVALSSFLANRLKQQLPTDGSMEYRQTWKKKITPLGRSYWAHTASALRTGDKDSTGAPWPTPRVSQIAMEGSNPDRAGNGKCRLEDDVYLAAWPTPMAEDSEQTGAHRRNPDTLNSAAKATWATPSSRDWKDTPGMAETGTNPDGTDRTRLDQLPRQAHLTSGPTPSGTTAETGKPAAFLLNPRFSLWLQGYRDEWFSSAARAIASSHKSRPSSSKS